MSPLFYKNDLTERPKSSLLLMLVCLLILMSGHNNIYGQDTDKTVKKKSDPKFEWKVIKDPEIKVKLTGLIQPWLRYSEMNQGSTDKDGNPVYNAFDVSIRRIRFGTEIMAGDKFKFILGFGENNFNSSGHDLPRIKVMDLNVNYRFSNAFVLGLGKSTWDGLSRYNAPSSATILLTDLQLLPFPTLNISDDIIRNLGIYAHGDIGKLNYRMVLKKPYDYDYTGAKPATPAEGTAQFTDTYTHPEFTTYLKYDLFDKEKCTGPNFTGTYLGNTRLLSLGLGMKYQSDALYSISNGTETFHDMKLLAADLFLEQPLQSTAFRSITAYLGYFDYDLGPDYLRMIGANNPAYGWENDGTQINGKGTSFPVIGTGESMLMQLGFLFNGMGKNNRAGYLQLYSGVQYSNFDSLNDHMICYSTGLNWYLNGQRSKFSLDLQNRPVFDAATRTQFDRKNMIVLQYQYKL